MVARARAAGFTDGEITEGVVEVALNLLTNDFNIFAGTEIDFPETDPRERAA